MPRDDCRLSNSRGTKQRHSSYRRVREVDHKNCNTLAAVLHKVDLVRLWIRSGAQEGVLKTDPPLTVLSVQESNDGVIEIGRRSRRNSKTPIRQRYVLRELAARPIEMQH